MAQFLENNQDLQNIDFLNFDSNRIFFRRPKINKAKSQSLNFDFDLESCLYDHQKKNLIFGVTVKQNVKLTVHFFREISERKEFSMKECQCPNFRQTQNNNNKNGIFSIFNKLPFCFGQEKIDNKMNTQNNEEIVENPGCSMLTEISQSGDLIEKKKIRITSHKNSLREIETEIREVKSEKIIQIESQKNNLNKSNYKIPKKEIDIFKPITQYSRTHVRNFKLFKLEIPEVFFSLAEKFPSDSEHIHLVLEISEESRELKLKKSFKMLVIFDYCKEKGIFPVSKLLRKWDGSLFCLKNIYDLVHETKKSNMRQTPETIKHRGIDNSDKKILKKDSVGTEEKKRNLKEWIGGKQIIKHIQKEKRRKRPWCSICLSEKVSTIILPCRHFCICMDCSKNLVENTNKCPICRQKIGQLVRIYRK